MQARVFLNISTGVITGKLDQSPRQWPTIPQGDDIVLKFQLSQLNGSITEVLDVPLHSAAARIGVPGAVPSFGAFKLVINPPEADGKVTAAIPYNFTGQQMADAINALDHEDLEGLLPCTVTQSNGATRIQFADKTADVVIDVAENSLWPASFVSRKEQSWDEGNLYVLELAQTSFSVASTLQTRPPDLPKVTRKQEGGETDGKVKNEIHRLVIPPSFAGGAFQLARDGVPSNLIALPTSEDELAAAIAPLKDEGGLFRVRSSSRAFYIEFLGSMAGQPFDELEVIPFDPPANDHYLKIKTDRAEMEELMRTANSSGQASAVLHLTIRTKNELDDEELDRHIFRVPLTFTRSGDDGGNNVSANLAWNQPPSRITLLPHSQSSRAVGHRSMKFVIGDGVLEEFALPHNLNGEPVEVEVDAVANTFTAPDHNFHNLDPVTFESDATLPPEVEEGKTYWITQRTDDDFKISERMGGAALDLTGAGSGTITAKINDGASDGVHVTVFERGGNKAKLPDTSYTVERTSDSTITLKDFPAVPTLRQYDVYITSVGRPSQWQDAEWPQNRVIDLVEDLTAIRADIAALKAQAALGRIVGATTTSAPAISRTLRPLWVVQPSKITTPAAPLSNWDPYALTPPLKPGRLFPAVHDAAVEPLPTVLPEPSSVLKGRVFVAATARDDIRGGVRAGDFVACTDSDWYRVVQEDEDEASYYPADLGVELFRTYVSANELVAKSSAELFFGFEVCVLSGVKNQRERRTAASCELILEIGTARQTTDPATAGANLEAFFASPVKVIEQRIVLAETATQHRFGLRVLHQGDGTLEAFVTRYRKELPCTAPASANFAIRGRLGRPDFEDDPSDPRGLWAVRGLQVGLDGRDDPTMAILQIS